MADYNSIMSDPDPVYVWLRLRIRYLFFRSRIRFSGGLHPDPVLLLEGLIRIKIIQLGSGVNGVICLF